MPKRQETKPSPKTQALPKAQALPEANRISDHGNLFSRTLFSSHGVKIGVVVVFTLCWLLIVLARSHTPPDPASLEGSSMVGLTTAMQHGRFLPLRLRCLVVESDRRSP